MKKNIAILLTVVLLASGCITPGGPNTTDLDPCPVPPKSSVTINLLKNGPNSNPPDVPSNERFVCVFQNGTIRFIVGGAAPNDSVVVVPKDPGQSWLFGSKPGNQAYFEIQADANIGDYDYSVFWTGKPGLDPRIGVRGGNSAMGGLNRPPTTQPNSPPNANENPPL